MSTSTPPELHGRGFRHPQMRLTKWQRFWRLDVPGGMIPLVWNGMLSFGGARSAMPSSSPRAWSTTPTACGPDRGGHRGPKNRLRRTTTGACTLTPPDEHRTSRGRARPRRVWQGRPPPIPPMRLGRATRVVHPTKVTTTTGIGNVGCRLNPRHLRLGGGHQGDHPPSPRPEHLPASLSSPLRRRTLPGRQKPERFVRGS
jgi:hypothetical protein